MAGKTRIRYVCQSCGSESARWLGRCPACGAWNAYQEERVTAPPPGGSGGTRRLAAPHGPQPLGEVASLPAGRRETGMGELDRVLGGGLVSGSVVLLGGDPGIGKSTLLLQVCLGMAAGGEAVLYVAGEESAQQVRLRAERLLPGHPLPDSLFILPETEIDAIEGAVDSLAPALAVIDSIQTVVDPALESHAGSVSQVRECAGRILRVTKGRGVATCLVGHINKEGALAGPKVLEHLVDAVLYLEGERHYAYRILRGAKNRFGSTSEIGVFSMGSQGLVEVTNPSELFLAERPEGAAGSVVVATVEGARPLLVEVQALLSGPAYGPARRTVTGVEHNRVALLLAVLEKRVGLGLGSYDAYVKVVGGMRLDEPAADLGLAVALASAFLDRPVDPHLAVAGEVGLAGEARAVARAEERVREAERLGFQRLLLPERNRRALGRGRQGLELIGVETVAQAIEAALEAAPRQRRRATPEG